ncbi:hypothetical protein [Parendozoicomonas haliclonae]|uniref:Uncharacterized protein n=1 Tax=Parendozoicomonas haliclonae TaxID=1960125 RepID=A0A1X7AGN8_9GAMM|nr:hypothetical protein [Parendozoicomonas haliclonae]SMA39276.1 hypothetical protein EHSB41UT_00998 [Parendozoicomonas haliclonae]
MSKLSIRWPAWVRLCSASGRNMMRCFAAMALLLVSGLSFSVYDSDKAGVLKSGVDLSSPAESSLEATPSVAEVSTTREPPFGIHMLDGSSFHKYWNGEREVVFEADFCLLARDPAVLKDLQFSNVRSGVYGYHNDVRFIDHVVFKGTGSAVGNKQIELVPNSTSSARLLTRGHNNQSCSAYSFTLQAVATSDLIDEYGLGGRRQGWLSFKITAQGHGRLYYDQVHLYLDLSIIPVYKISKTRNIVLNRHDIQPGNWLWEDMYFCVYGTGGARYSMTLDSSNSGGKFVLMNSRGESIQYLPSVRDTSPYGYCDVTPSQPGKINCSFISSRSQTCNGGTNARFRAAIPMRNLKPLDAGSYSDIMQITIGPE